MVWNLFRNLRTARIFMITGVLLATFCIIYKMQDTRDVIQWNSISVSNDSNLVVTHVRLPPSLKGRKLPFHQVYEPRSISFVNYSNPFPVVRNITKPKLILLWTPWNHQWKTVNYYFLQSGNDSFVRYHCPNQLCTTIYDRSRLHEADAILFHLLDLKESDMPKSRHPQQIWMIYVMEAPWLVYASWNRLKGIFNWTLSYREDSDVPVKYGFVGSRTTKLMKSLGFSEKKKSVLWLVSDCNTNSHREDYGKELARYIDVDVYGLCGTKKCFPSQSATCYESLTKEYKFYLSFENSICKDYVTEKFFNILNYDIIPVTFGGANYAEIAPPKSYIDATQFPNPKDLGAFLAKVGSSEILYASYFKWKETYQVYLYPWMCHLCDRLHNPGEPTSHNDLYKWWVTDANCIRWDKNKGFIRVQDSNN
ncbi:glycoprotein 3-alpha-L-fucosyltransferase A-like [Tachypleus tridentatus]|uniref:glycoprotein 3-alpha-L-fucosyltransferase A-like n=1 Tax=Tachypleus tridentatus TaxID=6853 RepID=UPI003FD48FD1